MDDNHKWFLPTSLVDVRPDLLPLATLRRLFATGWPWPRPASDGRSAKISARTLFSHLDILNVGNGRSLRVVGCMKRAFLLLPASIQSAGKDDGMNYIWGASDNRANPSA